MFTADEEIMWLRLKDSQREAETRRLLQQAKESDGEDRPDGGLWLRRWLRRLAGPSWAGEAGR